MKQQTVLTQTIRQTEIPALPDSSVIHTFSLKCRFLGIIDCLFSRKNWSRIFLSPVKLCIDGLRKIAASRVIWKKFQVVYGRIILKWNSKK
jgi:hypothetical protein